MRYFWMVAWFLLVLFALFLMFCPIHQSYPPIPPPAVVEPEPEPEPERFAYEPNRLISKSLCQVAQESADRMAATNCFRHTNLRPLVEEHGMVGENIAWAANWDQAYAVWRNSRGHRANMENPGYKVVGFGYNGPFFVVIYGAR